MWPWCGWGGRPTSDNLLSRQKADSFFLRYHHRWPRVTHCNLYAKPEVSRYYLLALQRRTPLLTKRPTRNSFETFGPSSLSWRLCHCCWGRPKLKLTPPPYFRFNPPIFAGLPSRVVRGRGLMYLLYPKNSTWRWLRAISTPRSEKCPFLFNDCATSELSMRAWNWNVTDSKKKNSTWLFHDIFIYDSRKKCSEILYAINLRLKPVSANGV